MTDPDESTRPKNRFAQADTLQDIGLHELIIAIDPTSPGGYAPIDKLEAHVCNIPHKAISNFVFDNENLLLQRRAQSKYHSGGLWSNTVCSHPRWKETPSACASRRLQEELGWQVELQEFAQLSYQAQVGELYENEHVHCFYGYFTPQIDLSGFNRAEVMDVEWVNIHDLHQRIESAPEQYSEWFKIYLLRHFDLIIQTIS